MFYARLKFAAVAVAGVMVLGAGAIAVAQGAAGKQGEPVAKTQPAAVAKQKFDTPVWSPDARWSLTPETVVGGGGFGHLDGPQQDILYTGWGTMSRLGESVMGGPYVFSSYDPELGRLHVVAGSASGVMDGPFSRARFAGPWSYMDEPVRAQSPDGRYLFIAEIYNSGSIRRADLEKQMVVSIPRPKGWFMNMFADNKGKLYVVMHGGMVHVCDYDGKVEKSIQLQMPGNGMLMLDSTNDRLYWGTRDRNPKWFVGYFDLKTSGWEFHGLIESNPERNKRDWMRAIPNSFTNFGCYTQVDGLYFGPDDPEKNFLYMKTCDTTPSFRLDLKKKEVWVLSKEKDDYRYIFSGQGRGDTYGLNESGDVGGSNDAWGGDPRILCYPRIK